MRPNNTEEKMNNIFEWLTPERIAYMAMSCCGVIAFLSLIVSLSVASLFLPPSLEEPMTDEAV